MTGDPAPRQRLRTLAAAHLGLSIPPVYDARIDAALLAAARALGTTNLQDTATALERHACESVAWQQAIAHLTVGETSFLRHRQWFRSLEQRVLRPMIEERRRKGPRRLRIWSAACATGEEPYTLAMMVQLLLPEWQRWDIAIVATDINGAALDHGRAAIYREWSLRELDAAQRAQYFAALAGHRFQVVAQVREMVSFRSLNLASPVYPDATTGIGAFDLILCNNVLIHFQQDVQRAAASRLVRCLAPGGWLATTPAEALAGWFLPLMPVNARDAIFFHEAAPHAAARPAAPRTGFPRMRPEAQDPPLQASAAALLSIDRSTPPHPTTPAAASITTRAMPGAATIERAMTLADCGDRPAARRLCEALLAEDSLNHDAQLLLAVICEEDGDLPTALSAARRAAYLEPASAGAHYMIGAVFARLGDVRQARSAMATVLRLAIATPADPPLFMHSEATLDDLRQAARTNLDRPAETGRRKSVGTAR